MVLSTKKFAILGAGNMGGALLKGLLTSGAVEPAAVAIHNKRLERTRDLAKRFGVRAASSNAECVSGADIVILAVKPQILPKVLEEIGGLAPGSLYVSVAAGISTQRIEQLLGGTPRVVRAMPNTPALIAEGATGLSAGQFASEEDLAAAVAIFEKVGRVSVVDEVHLDAVTGLSGSGPAYVMLIVEAFADAGVKVGLSREIALELAVQTLRGSARLLQETGEHPGKLKDMVTSPGGTAIAGLHTLEEGGLRTTIMNAVEAATRRAKELGEG
ncbi:MAG: pyrroline-5-carboxylate reductase [Deltaproteobacteria bacterium]|nr:pyrroline-5-carboxylate reductase [Deltaproteobacteria bacterium]